MSQTPQERMGAGQGLIPERQDRCLSVATSMEKIRIEQHSATGSLWFGGWLFTIGFLHLTFWQGALAIVLWPYDLGVHFSSLVR
jgi:hypothetical protein